jgi:hypothetical protein
MTTEKKAEKKERKPRVMTAKGFLAKLNGKAAESIKGFLDAYREYLLTGDVSYATAEIVEKVDNQGLYPEVLSEIKNAVFAHVLEVDRQKAEESIEKASQPSRSKKAFEALIFDAATGELAQRVKDDGETEWLKKGFDMPQDAERWCDRRLFDGCPSWYGEIQHNGKPWSIIERDDSIARILKKPGQPFMKGHKQSTSALGFGVKVRESAVRFSHG